MNRAVITGIGLICSNAENKKEFAETCFSGRVGMKECKTFTTAGLTTPFFGETCDKYSLDAPYDKNSLTDNRYYCMLEKSLREMMTDADIDRDYVSSLGKSCRMFFGTFIYTAEARNLRRRARKIGEVDNSIAFVNDYSAFAKKIVGVKGTVTTVTTACSSSSAAVGMTFDYIRHGICDCAIVVGVDNLSIDDAYGFHALRLLSNGICNPFDKNRDGINIGEGSVAFFIESLEHAKARQAKIYCELVGYALGNDAYHIVSPEPSGKSACNVMKNALDDAKISISAVDYINAHGTGTILNDSMELKAIEKLMADTDKKIWVSSTKSMIGHCMGAAGAIEIASVILSMNHKKYIPMPNLKNPIEHSEKICMSSETFPLEINYALSNNFAFAGNNSALVLKNFKDGD